MKIIVKNLKKSFKHNKVLKNVNFEIEPNKITGIIGDNGSGKTTIMKIIAGLYSKDSGTILNLPRINNKVDVCCMLENPAFNNPMTVRQILKYYVSFDIDENELFNYYMNVFNIDFIDKPYGKLSLGMKQKVAIIYMFLKNAKLILLDEITNGLDERIVHIFYDELNKYVKRNNAYVLISSHKIYELQPVCNIVYFLKDGTINKSINLDNDVTIKNIKKIIFNESKDATEFAKKISNSLISISNKEVILFFNDNTELKNMLTIANEYSIDQIINNNSSLEKIYFNYYEGK